MDQKKLAVIHIAKKELNLSEKEYRDILRNAAGVESAKDLDDGKFRKLMNVFMRSRHYRLSPDGITLRQRYFIRSMYQDLGWDQNHFDNFLWKYHHKKQLDRLTKREAIKVIESLKNVRAHQKAPPGLVHDNTQAK
jgi:phage gp16-like protein